MRTLLVFAILTAAAPAQGRLVAGPWRATLASPGGELPFGLELRRERGGWRGVLINGPERIEIADVDERDGRVTLSFAPYESSIEAEVGPDGQRLTGLWRARRDATTWSELAFEAAHGDAPRFPTRARVGGSLPGLPRRWSVAFEKDDDPAVAVLDADDQGGVHGTILTTLGDYRYLAGTWDGTALRLSCFDGAHAFLFRAARLPDDSLAGDFWSKDIWHETFTARPDADATMPDGFDLTSAREDVALSTLRFPDLAGERRGLDDPTFAGKARVLFVFGTWCPNCRDATETMVDLDRRYRDQGLSIVGLAFERTGDLALDLPQVQRYAKSQGIRYPILVAGIADKARASEALPLLDRVRAYPTTIFLDRQGRVRAVHTGFSGPATGPEHAALLARFDELIAKLLR